MALTILVLAALLFTSPAVAGEPSSSDHRRADTGRPSAAGQQPPSAALVKTAAELNESAASGDFVSAEGWIEDIRNGNGSWVIATLRDDSGEVLAGFPQYIRRQIETEPGDDPIGKRIRVSGVWDHKAMDADTQGIRVQNVVILD